MEFDALLSCQFKAIIDRQASLAPVCAGWLVAFVTEDYGYLLKHEVTPGWRWVRNAVWLNPAPMPQLTGEVATLTARVDEHLKKMGAVWK